MGFSLSSPAFAAHQRIPQRHCHPDEGENIPPSLEWTDPPEGTRCFALLVEDPDAPQTQPWVHWVAWGIPGEWRSLDEMAARTVSSGRNDFDETGWGGPLPPQGHGPHRYIFRLFALTADPDLPLEADKQALLAAIDGAVLGEAQTVGIYER